ncbi:MAG TPA: triose-phosphate isomerase [Alphaproteobacteria bacterium]|nr:triose-phosphate isomerase [Alphaproteobacteria bacterium]
MPRSLIAGNWKMNGLSADGWALADEIVRRAGAAAHGSDRGPELLVCPPATLIGLVAEAVVGSSVGLGGQDCHPEDAGAHTGDISARMLADLGCRYVIVGHSERRSDHGETSAVVAAKAKAAQRAGLTAIVCVGETWAEREAGRTAEVVARQVRESVPDGSAATNLVIAYEPVWAIGSGRTPTVAQVAEVHGLIRGELDGRAAEPGNVRILYGGSVKPANARDLLTIAHVNGALVGGASLKADDFMAIAAAVTPS